MSDILEQINSLTEQFSNLLGEELEKEGPKKPEVTSLDFDPFKYGMLMNELSKDKHKYLKAMGQAQYDKGSTEEKELVQRKKSKREKKEMKMNDNNSYNEVVSQINSLTEQFSNLFEVEGLGDPASDVPPSTNKIKKDRKTKDGKVELVSVEDELFPYDGNKREQYRQKIIDTINNMIQGTATLEDLLQIVRQKKMPVKEGFEGAIELSELFDRPDLLDDISMALTNKTIKQHLENQAKKLLGGRKKKKVACKACEGLEEATALLEEIINEYLVSDIKNASSNAIKTRLQKYKDVKNNFSSTPEDIKRASDRVDRAVKIKKLFGGKRYKDERKVDSAIKSAIEKATKVMSPEEIEKDREEKLQKVMYRQPSHNFPPSPSGFKYGAKLKTNR